MGDCVMRIPLRDRWGTVRDWALVDAEDFEWLSRWRWYIDSSGYAGRGEYIGLKRLGLLMHREILGLQVGDSRLTDHRNRNRLDNRRANLRVATPRQNAQNCSSRPGARSRFRGVSWTGRRWMARVTVEGVEHYLGVFDDEEEAGRVAADFRAEHMPFAEAA